MKIISELGETKVTLIGPIVRILLNKEHPYFEFNLEETKTALKVLVPLSIHTDIGSAIVYTSELTKKRTIYTFGAINVLEDDSELDKDGNPVIVIRRN